MRAIYLVLSAFVVTGCENVDIERMIDQPSYRAYEASELFADGKAMREPPPGTIPRSEVLGPPEVVHGVSDGHYVENIPLAMDRARIEHGRRLFDVYCATCHGAAGDGQSQVAENMKLRPPRSLVAPPVSDYPAGRIFHTASVGYGLMPGYANELSVDDRWAVLGYIEVLQLRQGLRYDELPARARQEAQRWLK